MRSLVDRIRRARELSPLAHALALVLGAAACGDDNGRAEGASAASSSASSDTGAPCPVGSEGCPCLPKGGCDVGLACIADVCEPGSAETSSAATTASTTSADESTSGGTTSCSDSQDCEDDEVCAGGTCFSVWGVFYEITVETWSPPDCTRVIGENDLMWELEVDGSIVHSSATAGCPGAWSTSVCVLPDGVFDFVLYDYDPESANEFLDELCWPDPTNINLPCGDLDPDVLHAGEYDGSTLYGQARVRFDAVVACR